MSTSTQLETTQRQLSSSAHKPTAALASSSTQLEHAQQQLRSPARRSAAASVVSCGRAAVRVKQHRSVSSATSPPRSANPQVSCTLARANTRIFISSSASSASQRSPLVGNTISRHRRRPFSASSSVSASRCSARKRRQHARPLASNPRRRFEATASVRRHAVAAAYTPATRSAHALAHAAAAAQRKRQLLGPNIRTQRPRSAPATADTPLQRQRPRSSGPAALASSPQRRSCHASAPAPALSNIGR